MPNPKFEITNPEAIELIRKIKAGEIFLPLKQFAFKWRWIIIGAVVLFSLLAAVAIGKSLSRDRNQSFVPPSLDDISIAPTKSKNSSFDNLRKQLIDFGVGMPDPALPVLDNNISLEPVAIE